MTGPHGGKSEPVYYTLESVVYHVRKDCAALTGNRRERPVHEAELLDGGQLRGLGILSGVRRERRRPCKSCGGDK